MSMKTLIELKKKLGKLKKPSHSYSIPSVWRDLDFDKPVTAVKVNPREFFLDSVNRILTQPRSRSITTKGKSGNWSKQAIIYNLFVRLGTAFDHNQNGKIDVPSNPEGFRETGTFLKSIALLPYIKALGADTIHLLPITMPGVDGRKGNLGSPYAIRDPYHLDENLSEPTVGFGVEKEFKAFMEAAHHLGMAVVLEFVFRTSSKDGQWVKKHPEWFYWIEENILDRPQGSRNENYFGAPIFDPKSNEIIKRYEFEKFSKTIPPPLIHRNMFFQSPKSASIKMEKNRWVGKLVDGTRVRIPGAFADWPPDDPQPPWGDVTYLKLYDHPDFNYMAYNTLRMYDSSLKKEKFVQKKLWKEIESIIPHYQKKFSIDGVMIDMGHALPPELLKSLIKRARRKNSNFAFWEENFSLTQQSVKNGYNLSAGYLWCDIDIPHKVKAFLERCASPDLPISFLGTVENHDTSRTASKGGEEYSEYCWVLSCLLPGVPYIHGGFEIGETVPVNTGLWFSPEEILRYPSQSLPLFSSIALNWLGFKPMLAIVRDMAKFRRANSKALSDPKALRVTSEGDEIELVSVKNKVEVRAKINPKLQQIQLLQGRS